MLADAPGGGEAVGAILCRACGWALAHVPAASIPRGQNTLLLGAGRLLRRGECRLNMPSKPYFASASLWAFGLGAPPERGSRRQRSIDRPDRRTGLDQEIEIYLDRVAIPKRIHLGKLPAGIHNASPETAPARAPLWASQIMTLESLPSDHSKARRLRRAKPSRKMKMLWASSSLRRSIGLTPAWPACGPESCGPRASGPRPCGQRPCGPRPCSPGCGWSKEAGKEPSRFRPICSCAVSSDLTSIVGYFSISAPCILSIRKIILVNGLPSVLCISGSAVEDAKRTPPPPPRPQG